MKMIEATPSPMLAPSVRVGVCYSLWGERDRHLHRSQLKDLGPADAESMETAKERLNSLKRWSNVLD